MKQEQKIERIRAKCQEILELGKLRTQGKWEADNWGTTIQTEDQIVAVATTSNRENDSSFIASCAGTAEAMARSTLVAIELIKNTGAWNHHADDAAKAILESWPDELL
jgi:hypothetical protein